MIHFKFSDKDKRYLFLKGDTEADRKMLNEIKSHINLVDPICYLKTYNGPPFTQDFMFTYAQSSGNVVYYCSIGLWQVVYDYLKKSDYPFDGLVENQKYFKNELPHTFEQFKEIVDSWGLKYKPRPYQYSGAYKILQWKQSVSEFATRAGKTMLSYIIFRYAFEYFGVKKILMIVPSIDLVQQGYNDFKEYADFFNTECVWGGGKLVESSNLTIGTFQSLIKFLEKGSKKYNPKFFDDYDCVFVDETHRATASQINTIISQPFMKNVKIAFGMTGTLPKPKTIPFYCLHSLLGAKIQEIKPRELMDEGYISDIEIHQIRLNYPNEDKYKDLFIKCAEYALSDYVMVQNPKNPKKKMKVVDPNGQFLLSHIKEMPFGIITAKESLLKKYNGNTPEFKQAYIDVLKSCIKDSTGTNNLVIEKMISHFCDERIDYLCNNILTKCNKNTLILAHHTEYINYFAEIVKENFPTRHIYVITGSVNSKKRNEIKEMLAQYNDCILIASYGVMSTGITLPNLCFGVLFESFKSDVINMQSLGRGLGLSDMKDKYVVYDVIDCFDKSYSSRKIYLQGLEKIKIYIKNKYKYNIINYGV